MDLHKEKTCLKNLLLKLWLTKGAGPVFVKKLLTRAFGFDLADGQFYKNKDSLRFENGCPTTISGLCGLNLKDVETVQKNLVSQSCVDQELELLAKNKIKLVSILDSDYPSLLRQIYAPPPILTVQGSLENDWTSSISIVGSRAAKNYASRSLDIILPGLIEQKVSTVSGGAIGVDTMAHEKTLALGGKTFVILGSGLLEPYPSSNKKLFEKIADGNGAVVSAFQAQSNAQKGNFPARNRIVAGMTPGCLVVQAAKKSGALITSEFALQEGREVMTIPGPIDDLSFEGNNNLLIQGATPVTRSSNILQAVGQTILPCHSQQQELFQPAQEASDQGLTQYMDNPISLEELSKESGLTIDQAQEELFELEMSGKVTQNSSGTWQRV